MSWIRHVDRYEIGEIIQSVKTITEIKTIDGK